MYLNDIGFCLISLECMSLIQLHLIFRLDYIILRSVFLIYRIAGHPLAQNERCLHMFLQEQQIDKNYVPGKIRNT